MNWLDVLRIAIVPVCLIIPGAAPLAPLIAGAILEAEQLPHAKGAEKKAHALNLVAVGVAAGNAVTHRQVIDPAEAVKTASQVIDASISVVNVIHAAQAPGSS